MNKQDLLAQIIICFQPNLQPGIAHIIREDCSDIWEAIEIRNSFKDHTWETISTKILTGNKAALGYLSDDSFIYYLPAYMKLLIVEFETADVIADDLIQNLTLPSATDVYHQYDDYKTDEHKSVDLDEYFKDEIKNMDDNIHDFIRKTALLTYEQSRCILNFLHYLDQNNSTGFEENILARAIKRYWFKFS